MTLPTADPSEPTVAAPVADAPDTSVAAAPVVDAPAADRPTPRELLARTVADAALGVDGVHHLGTPAGRALASARTVVTGRESAPGVRILARATGTTVQVSVVADYPRDVNEVAERVQTRVSAALAGHDFGPLGLAGVVVVVTDVHGPFDREPLPEPEVVEPARVDDASAEHATSGGSARVADQADGEDEAPAVTAPPVEGGSSDDAASDDASTDEAHTDEAPTEGAPAEVVVADGTTKVTADTVVVVVPEGARIERVGADASSSPQSQSQSPSERAEHDDRS